ncbi:energy-coupling factor transporter ATP-binding protein EcfA2 [Algoriphagus iocasae]|uniref:Energy-coupling factor transporter ATP-binding protein EcfA2 n=1 Tax=Algoriphagus iocasae TaxID=1836499 RepID=A0A841N0F6_9BACT|nr:hypothetical protein [Algoriphagus iocasae]MBB6328398.1 energy-coupling factor transporter ATP-binding protein EcfA2 [Algoriphagus iocasae]
MMQPDNFYTTYNARHLAPQEVAKTFIWSDSYSKLIQNNHSVILGARGCGKTTLMKMLTLPALYAWDSEGAKDVRENIPFYGIYISTDIYWDVKNQTYSSQLKPYGNFAEQISHFSVNSNVFSSLCDTFLNIISIELEDFDEDKEVELCKELIKAWKIPAAIPKLRFIKEALNERIDEVNQLIQKVIFNYDQKSVIQTPDYFNLNFESSIELVIPKFERIYGIQSSTKKSWALCFDELEFAPIWLQKKLFRSLRSRKQFILYKLSASPILSIELEKTLKGDYTATSGNDVQMIKMWSSSDNESFSKRIIESFVSGNKDLTSFFGTNAIYNKSPDSYTEGSEFYNELKSLIAKDDSFKKFLSSKGIDVDNPIPNTKEQKDVLFRKIKPIVYHRNYFIESNRNSKVTLRSRKKAIDLFSGIEVLAKVCDGNPRWLIGMMSLIMVKSKDRADKVTQYNEILNASNRFKNVIANIPIGKSAFTITDLIEKIGSFFKEQVHGPDFKMDPKGTFVVDQNEHEISKDILELIDKGVSQGAFILLDSNDDSFDFEIRGKRFKLSYLFSILYDLPIRTYTEIKLSECLSGKGLDTSQMSIFRS